MPLEITFDRAKVDWFSGSSVLLTGTLRLMLATPSIVFGGNGSGKTTLIASLGRVFKAPYGGVKSVDLDRVSIQGERTTDRIGYVRQEPYENFLGGSLVDEFRVSYANTRFSATEFKELLSSVLSTYVDLKDVVTRNTKTLSAGEQQLAAIALALLGGPDAVLLDEPFARLSDRNRIRAARMLSGNTKGCYVLLTAQLEDKASELFPAVTEYEVVQKTGELDIRPPRPLQNPGGAGTNFETDANFKKLYVSRESYMEESVWSQGFEQLPTNGVRAIIGAGPRVSNGSFDFEVKVNKQTLTRTTGWDLHEGITLLYGDNGSGKTLIARTLAHNIATNPYFSTFRNVIATGTFPLVTVSEMRGPESKQSLQQLRRQTLSFFLPAEPELFIAEVTVRDEIENVCQPDEVEGRVSWLSELGISENAACDELSYGQRKLVAFSTLPKQLPLVILDEPFANLGTNLQEAEARFILERIRVREWLSVVITTNRPVATIEVISKAANVASQYAVRRFRK